MRIAYLSPLPPARTGIAHYSSMLLRAWPEVTPFGSLDGYRRGDFDVAVYQLGNNPHHEWIYKEAMAVPGIAVLHDVVLHHLIVEMTLACGDAEAYVAALEANHGAAGAAWARGRAAGLHSEMGNFLLPASVELARRSRAVVVHNRWAAERLASFGVTTPVHVVPHPYVPDTAVYDRDALRARLGFTPEHRVIGFFGFLTSAKRAEVVIEAFRQANDPRLRLLIVGEPAPNIDLSSIEGEGVVTTGYVSDEEFGAYYAAADRLVNLRYPSAGETSGTLIRAFDAGKPVAVSDYAQFAEYPDACVVKIPFGEDEVPSLVSFFTRELPSPAVVQRRWLEENATLESTVAGYRDAIGASWRACPHVGHDQRGGKLSSLSLFVRMSVININGDQLTIRNDGPATLRTRVYGRPAYRLIAKLFDGEREIADRWLELPRDLRPGDEATLTIPHQHGATLRLYHALEGIPIPIPEAWHAATL